MPLSRVILEIGQCMIKQFFTVTYIASGMNVYVVLITNYLFKHWLDTTRNIVNPFKLIGQVLNYPRKNKYPKNRSALTYWEEDYPSRLDLSNEKYGGPFSVEQVEDVKTVLRLIPLIVVISAVELFCARELTANCFSIQNRTPQFISCFVLNNSLYFSVAAVLILLYQLLIYPCFYIIYS